MKEIIERAVRGGLDINADTFLENINYINSKIRHSCSDAFIDSIIFSHEFLKAYFGEGKHDMVYPPLGVFEAPYCKNCKVKPSMYDDEYCWQYHGQQLVLSEDREEYLRRYL